MSIRIEEGLQKQLNTIADTHQLDLGTLTKGEPLQTVLHRTARKELLQDALNRVSMSEPGWTYIGALLYLDTLYQEAAETRKLGHSGGYHDFGNLIFEGVRRGLYDHRLTEAYTFSELEEAGTMIDSEKDLLFQHTGLFLLADRYLTRTTDGELYELPQERFLIIALVLMMNEPHQTRLSHVREAYWAMSNLYMTVATPTLANAGKSHGQLSSCFIDTVDDSLDSIYLNNWDIARLSKDGGGIGVYYGKVRALGSDIKGFKGNSSGVVPWVRQLNNTAVSVDQLGQRQGAIAIYLDIFHKDIMNGFLDLKTNNGDERRKAHDIFTGITIPDLFMKKLEEKDEQGKSIGEWHVFCPHEIKKIMGWTDEQGNPLGLEDFYDEADQLYFTEKYEEAVAHPLLPRQTYRAMDIMARMMVSQLETGTPFFFYRDEVNRRNANKHSRTPGRTAIYSSNLCTEIAQNMSATTIQKEYETPEGDQVIVRRPGDFVVCNLSSINLGRSGNQTTLKRLIPIQMRMLDNVIDLNNLPVQQAQRTNRKYRAVGLGTFGWHHYLAKNAIHWESEEAVTEADKLYEQIAYLTIEASKNLALEKGAYPAFQGSEWENGDYFEQRDYVSEDWLALKEEVKESGVRNGWMMAIAPNSSTAKIGGSTDGIDPLYAVEFAEEKKNFKFLVTAPELDHNTYPFYRKTRHQLDQQWSIRQNAARQRHIDQGISFNLYVHHNIRAKELLELHLSAWRQKLKTTYYIRSTSQEEIETCDVCES